MHRANKRSAGDVSFVKDHPMRMLRQTFAILLLAVGVCLGAAQAQQAPDDEDIFARTLDEASPYYYPSLMMR